MVCTDGVPSDAALDLLNGLARVGCPIRVRADVDQNGLVTVDQVRRVAPQATWPPPARNSREVTANTPLSTSGSSSTAVAHGRRTSPDARFSVDARP
jgi:hypothetical protein